ncbi:hypothetical protein A2160_00750 [Candidatus Beckwithbacteria bacterium RBG_13_42_9]|uniref:Uncharacterized protein n=1 Tax=Candidatus Beckwithbacteria bacterium RBG_13_42_9 TaxID=1797457 RepID=A0A1F5E4H9_9BACT|nr:MAG: hypothetical protein A2160_00750 [Candidatus Beckwithbacteria bacterium RBG_13_42_9]
MLLDFLLTLFLLGIIFFTSRQVIKTFYFLGHRATGSNFWSVQLLSWLLLPGTLLHEFSHLLVAEFLGVKTGKIDLLPKINQDEESVKLGSVLMAESDPFRRTLIGLAPTLFGLGILGISVHYLNFSQPLILLNLLFLLLIFIVANTMFSSAKDLEMAAVPAIILFLLAGALWLGKISIPISPSILATIQTLIFKLNLALALTAGLNLLVWLLLRLVLRLIK